ncbi:YciI family protein [Xylanimonas protaetiae]|uniref:YCII-related domain-containing protein n=1 Tax=Xylanimonas protaetiae TaxID=2509457 RepID=A0A4P6FLQ0_9MICO|nr:YciI family protein [Xylanimonas protaetiae]QAY71568.1 hypothetical protein ET471_17295 [Xylanimonas protaetiae]
MRYVVLIHSDPEPWGHPTVDFTAEGRAVPSERRAADGAAFDAFLADLSARGELVAAEALAAPSSATLLRWSDGGAVATEGPYAEAGEHLAGFFLVDVATPERAREVAARFAGPGDTVELRPAYVWPS